MRRVLSAVGYTLLGFLFLEIILFLVQGAAFLLGVRLDPSDVPIVLSIGAYIASLARYGKASFSNWLIMLVWSLCLVLMIPYLYYVGLGVRGKRGVPVVPPVEERDPPKPIVILTCQACGALNPCTNVTCKQCGGPLLKPKLEGLSESAAAREGKTMAGQEPT